jgi:hypothetical protein
MQVLEDGTYEGCFFPLESEEGADPMAVLGTAFLKGYYTVFEVSTTPMSSRFGFAPHSDSAKLALTELDLDAEVEAMPDSVGTVLEDKAIFEEQNPLPEEPAADSAYYLNSALVISSLLTFVLI